jgi:hypothetical protein
MVRTTGQMLTDLKLLKATVQRVREFEWLGPLALARKWKLLREKGYGGRVLRLVPCSRAIKMSRSRC